MTLWLLFAFFSGEPVSVWQYKTLAECEQAAQTYVKSQCVKVELK